MVYLKRNVFQYQGDRSTADGGNEIIRAKEKLKSTNRLGYTILTRSFNCFNWKPVIIEVLTLTVQSHLAANFCSILKVCT